MPSPPTVPQQPVISYFDPNKTDRGLIEYWSTETTAYTAIDVGTPHPNTRDYLGFRLGIQQAVPNNFSWIRRVYVTDETNPDWFNAQLKFSSESIAHPIFIRSYREDKKTYTPRAKLSPLDTVIKVTVFNAGSGYTPGTFPNLTFVGGGGSGALGRGIVAANGSIADLVLDDGGTGFTSAPTFTVDPPVAGVTATGTAVIQPQTALLVAEQADEYPADSEFFGLYFNVTRVYETLPGPVLTTRTIGQPNLTPEKYRRLVRNVETDQTVSPDYAFPSGLVGDQVQVRLQEETVAKARLKIISEIINITGDALLGGDTSEWGPLAIYESVVNEGTAIDQGFLVLKSTVTPFGNGKAVRITVKYPLDLALKQLLQKSLGQDNLIPEKYRRLVRHNVTESLVDPASYIFPIKLYGDESLVSYIEETIQRARLKVVEEIIDNISSLVGQKTEEFGIDRITETIVNDGTPSDSAFLVHTSQVTPLGNGKSIKITAFYPSNLADQRLHGQTYISSVDIPIPWQERLIPAGTEIGDNRKEITPIDQTKSRVRELDLQATGRLATTLLAFPSTTSISFPDILVSVSGLIESSSGDGSDTEAAGAGGFSGAGSWTVRPTSRSTASASMIPELDIRIKQVWAENIPTSNFLFYLPMPVLRNDVLSKLSTLLSSSVLPWPKFKPESVSLILKGERLSLEANARAYGHIGGSASSSEYAFNQGSGFSHENSLTIKAVRIPLTIHGTINLTGTVFDTTAISAFAEAATGYFFAGPYIVNEDAVSSQSGSVSASISPTSISATAGDTTIPTSGLRLHRLNVEPFIYGWARVQASVIDFADI